MRSLIRVLVVDDDEDMRALFHLVLEKHGAFEVVGQAADGATGIVLATELQPDVVLLDLRMPVMDGLQALPRILEGASRTKVVVLSGFADEAMAANALAAGASAYLSKGVELSCVVDQLLSLIGSR